MHFSGGQERCLLSLTVRDSESGFINVTCWGSEEYIQGLTASVTYGSVGKNIVNLLSQ